MKNYLDLVPSPVIVNPLIEMFNVCPICEETLNEEDQRILISEALKHGFIFDKDCMNVYAVKFIDSHDMKYNSTFYKTWSEVSDASRLDLLIDQLLHYMTANSDYMGFVPNIDQIKFGEEVWSTYKHIEAITFDDLYERCFEMIKSGIALKSETVKSLIDYIVEYCKYNDVTPDVDSIKNREAMTILCDKLNILPNDGAKLFSYIVYKATGDTMIVKNRNLRKKIRLNNDKVETIFMHLNKKQKIALAGVFNRYKELFIAFKTRFSTASINKISHLSKKHHKPMRRGFWETILINTDIDKSIIMQELEKATNFKLIQVMQSIRERLLLARDGGESMYIIRDGKIFIKDNAAGDDTKYCHWVNVYNMCKTRLVKNLSAKACKIKLPKNYELSCPTSEKNFIGNIPMGTTVQLGKGSVIGIYWRNEWGTRDFDLSYNTIDGDKIGWNANYSYGSDEDDTRILYSGDITSAPYGANEILYFGSDAETGLVRVNRYSGNPNSKYRMFFGTDTYENVKSHIKDRNMESYMVDPGNIQLESEVRQGEMAEQLVGMIHDGKFYFYTLSCGYNRVSTAMYIKNGKNVNKTVNSIESITDILKRKTLSFIPLKEILLKSGFEVVEDDYDMDLTELNRDTLIKLFSK